MKTMDKKNLVKELFAVELLWPIQKINYILKKNLKFKTLEDSLLIEDYVIVCEQSIDNILYYISRKDFMSYYMNPIQNKKISAIPQHETYFVVENTTLEQILKKSGPCHDTNLFAVVVDCFGNTIGVVTMASIIDSLIH